MSNYITNGEELAEAKRKLIHRYELTTKRAKEMAHADSYAAFLDAFASALDPHSNYFTVDAMEDFKIGMELSLEGIGVALSSRDGYSVVENTLGPGATTRKVTFPRVMVPAVAGAPVPSNSCAIESTIPGIVMRPPFAGLPAPQFGVNGT